MADATNLIVETIESNNLGAVALHIEHPQEWTHGGPAGRIDQLAVDPGNSAVAYCVSEGRLYKSTDAGGTWSPIDHRFLVFNLEYPVTKLLVDCSGDLLVIAGGLFKGTQGGSQWQKLLSGTHPYDPGDFSVLNAGIDPNDPQVLFASYYAYTYMGMGPISEGLSKSTDGGHHWFGVRLDHPRYAEVLVHPELAGGLCDHPLFLGLNRWRFEL